MANARLRMARETNKYRHTTDAQSTNQSTSETPSDVCISNDPEGTENEPNTPTSDTPHAVREALAAQKRAIEERLHALTLGKPLTRLSEPGFDANGVRLQRTHRDFLLQEMEWMAADFAQERKWRLKSARTLANALATYHSKQATRAARQRKLEDDAKRRLAARIGRDVKQFWRKIDKIISFKVKLQSDELRRAAMDQHLTQLVAQTERYAAALASTFSPDQPVPGSSDNASLDRILDTGESLIPIEPDEVEVEVDTPADTAAGRDASDDDDSDFAVDDDDVDDDESTIAAADAQTSRADVAEEIALLAAESEVSIDDLRRQVAAAMAAADTNSDLSISSSDDGESDDFEPVSGDDVDDERTIAAADALDTEDAADELALLQQESKVSVDELRRRYADALAADSTDDRDASISSDDDVGAVGTTSGRQRDSGSAATERLDSGTSDGLVAATADSDDNDDDFATEDDEPDDETTIERDEHALGLSKQQLNDEVELLQQESELSIDELRARYARVSSSDDDSVSSDDDDDSASITVVDNDTSDAVETTAAGRVGIKSDTNTDTDVLRKMDQSTLSPATTTTTNDQQPQPAEPTAAATTSSASVSSVPTTTLAASSSATGFRRPFLLTSRLTLREYQQAGVNWLIGLCDKRINGILADEMGLGKTIQTITLLAHLASVRGLWGPHLIVVPTSCLVNWEMECKRWCPALKILTYFGTAKRRKALRQGWSKPNAFHVCITSYQLAVQDAHCFKRKRWYYVILDEAHHIKNWKSLRWQTLLTFHAQRRLLLTGTPLQNNVLELWSLMHFLMPHVFASRREFAYWFQTPLATIVENESGSKAGTSINSGTNSGTDQQQLVAKLHGIIRPFVLRRLKQDVAKQLPGKFEHVVVCKLSRRQRFLYEDFIARSSTRRALAGSRGTRGGGNVMSMMNVLMQLRKVCNHPDLFEPRPIASPLDLPQLTLQVSSRCCYLLDTLVLESPRFNTLPFWTYNLPALELAGAETFTSTRRQQLFFIDDVSAALPPETQVSDVVTATYKTHRDILARLVYVADKRMQYWREKRVAVAKHMQLAAALATDRPVFGADVVRACTLAVFMSHAMDVHRKRTSMRAADALTLSDTLCAIVRTPEDRVADLAPIVARAVCFVPRARARPVRVVIGGGGFTRRSTSDFALSRIKQLEMLEQTQFVPVARTCLNVYFDAFRRTQLFFPDKRLVQFDCGKLQQLDALLRQLKRGNHRCLIFTQMSSMLNILEVFLNIHGHTYFRLDGSTKVEKRQVLMDRFNRDDKVFCFILSTRSGGLGINLTGADAVIFYDSDWNPAMDAQAQDRAHRIGQTRDVHIYRLVSEHTVEENILRKAQQKRQLDTLVMADGEFTTDFFSRANLRELVTGRGDSVGDDGDDGSSDSSGDKEVDLDVDDWVTRLDDDDDRNGMSLEALEDAMAQFEDEDDVVAMHGAKEEVRTEQREFDDETTAAAASSSRGTKTQARQRSAVSKNRRQSGSNSSSQSLVAATQPSTPSSMSVNSSLSGRDDDDDDEDVDNDDDDTQSVDGRSGVAVGDAKASSKANAVDDAPGDGGGDKDDDDGNDDDASSDDGSGNGDSDDSIDDDDDDVADDEPRTGATRSRQRKRAATTSNRPERTKVPRHHSSTSASTSATAQRKHDKAREKARELEDERKLQAWKDSVASLQNFEDALHPVDRYALHFREQVDPLFAYVPTAAALESASSSTTQLATLDVERIDAEKAREEAALIADGELIAGIMDSDEGDASIKSTKSISDSQAIEQQHVALYKRERAHVRSERRRRQLTGEAWTLQKCALTNHPFYFNVDTREASWDQPAVWAANDALASTRRLGYSGLSLRVLLGIMQCLAPYPDRMHVQLVCATWRSAARHTSLNKRVSVTDLLANGGGARSLSDLFAQSAVGETLLFSAGVYAIDDVVEVPTPVKLLAAPDAHVELQMTTARAQLRWSARGGMLCGFHITRQSHAAADDDSRGTNGITGTSHTDTDDSRGGTGPGITGSGTIGIAGTGTVGGGSSVVGVPGDTLCTSDTTADTASTTERDAAARTTTWQHLLHVVNGGHVRVLFCDFDGRHGGNACVAVSGSAASRAVLVNNRIYHSGSSGVLLAKGELVMVLNTVTANAHSGISVLMGNALLRRNVVAQNGRFGIRLLYHANNVIVEENVVHDHPCGNVDVEHSGRRFVVRWNEMTKGEPTDLPHAHGALRLATYKIVEREVARNVASSSSGSTKLETGAEVPTTLTAGSTLVPAANTLAAVKTAPTPLSALASMTVQVPMPVPTLSLAGAAVGASAASASADAPPGPPPAPSAVSESTASASVPAIPPAAVAAASVPVSAADASTRPQTTMIDLATESTTAAAAAVVALGASLSVATAEVSTAPMHVVDAGPIATTPSIQSTTVSTVTSESILTGPPPTALLSTLTTSAPSPQQRIKLKRKRRPKTERLVVSGHVIVFRDSCERRCDKVKKPRTLRLDANGGANDAATEPLASAAGIGDSVGTDGVSADSVDSKHDAIECVELSANDAAANGSRAVGFNAQAVVAADSSMSSDVKVVVSVPAVPAAAATVSEVTASDATAALAVVGKQRGRKPNVGALDSLDSQLASASS